MDRTCFDNLPTPLTEDDLRWLTEYAKTRTKAFVSNWTPDQVLVQRFAEVATELLQRREGER